MTATTTEHVGELLIELNWPEGGRGYRPAFQPEDEMIGAALALAYRAGDWCEQFEALAMTIRKDGVLTIGHFLHHDYSRADNIGRPPGVAWFAVNGVLVRHGYDHDYTSQAHKWAGSVWHGEPDVRAWAFPPSKALLEWLDRWGIVVSDDARRACGETVAEEVQPELPNVPDPEPMPAPPQPVIAAETEGGEWIIGHVGYDPELIAWIESAPGLVRTRAGDFSSDIWRIQMTEGADLMPWLEAGMKLGVQGLADRLEQLRRDRRHFDLVHSAGFDASRALTPSPGFTVPGMDLRPFQLAAVEYGVTVAKDHRVLIGDEMGLGKSVEALATIQYLDAFPCLIVAPASIVINWRKEVNKWLPGRTVDEVTTRSGVFGEADVSVVGYEALGIRLSAAVRADWGSIIIDEAHFIKNPSALRSINVGIVAEEVDGPRIAMSGTFVKNKNHDADNPCKVIGREDIATEIKRDRANQSAILRANCMVRRKKRDVMPDLPALQSSLVYVEPDPKVWKEYLLAERELITYVKQRAAELAAALGKDPEKAATEAAIRAHGAEFLVQITHLRRLSGLAKTTAALEYAKQFNAETDRSLIIFGHHHDVLEALAGPLKCDILMGGVGQRERDISVEKFQAGENRNLVIGFQAGGLGLTITAANDMLLVEQQWTPADMDQAYGRSYGRINDAHGLSAIHLAVEGSIDEWMFELIEDKRKMASQTLDDEEYDEIMKTSVMGDLIIKLAEVA